MATFTYADAVKLLGGNDSKIVKALDGILGTALLGGSVLSVSDLLSWFDAKAEFIRLSGELAGAVSQRRGSSRIDRTRRLHAAHSVIVIVAFFEAFDELGIPFTTKSLDMTRQRQLVLQENSPATIHDAAVPLLTPDQPYESFVTILLAWYQRLAAELARLVQRLALWDDLTETAQDRALEKVTALPKQSVRRYEELFRRLAVDCPEVGFWVARLDAQATRGTLGVALRRLSDSLVSLSTGDTPTAQRQELTLRYQSALNHPILDSGDAPGGLTIPLLSTSYIDPFFQVNDGGSTAFVAQKAWWESRQVRTDMYRFIVGYLTSPAAWAAPLLVLGDPGSGKSLLTKVLAARLPASDYLVVRVELREAPADADVLDQIEHAIKRALKEDVSWPSLVRSAPRALPVVLLDGFDELLQATGVNQTDYLTRIARFQRDRADVDLPVAFVVTSRISVANRAALPADSVVVRLTEFTDEQKRQWLDIWRHNNIGHFEAHGLRPLDLATVQRYEDLSAHPLLLLMLALYDAEGNPLQQAGAQLDEAELYERLLTRFASREVAKEGSHRTDTELAQAIQDELERLSIVAFAMFNRGSQWVTEADLDKDLAVFQDAPVSSAGIRSALSAGVIALGRFFFVQRSRATRDSQALYTYEFLHATFGEYLVARHIWNVLSDLPRRVVSRRSSAVDDSELYALLSFVPLSNRTSILGFLVERSTDPSPGLLTEELFRAADHAQLRARYTEYAPMALSTPERFAIYRANLLLLTTSLSDVVRVSELCRQPDSVVPAWNKYTRLWKATLTPEDWQAFVDAFTLHRVWNGDNRDIELVPSSYADPGDPEWLDVEWWRNREVAAGQFVYADPLAMEQEAHFLCDEDEDLKLNALRPYSNGFDHGILTVVSRSGRATTHVEALLGLFATEWTDRNDQDEYLRVLAHFHDEGHASDLIARAVFDAVRARPDQFDFRELASHAWIATSPHFWGLICTVLGTPHHGDDLAVILAEHWRPDTAYQAVPELVADAWLRMAEGGFTVPACIPDIDVVLANTLPKIAETRPDLVKRAHNFFADRER
ncbi:NACHT domain-containing protein [Kibdelosporangium phytohabitans]|uniref:NACHT N-terminal Helical domain-containing protein n=1 Tax=Kibdelosporangium phytohabitans TaxID=860235 RepID=A0A0N9I3L9_9PSEU|nr:hypothetical protein [Kibdelosporangium phytohabitans]ALG09101.1 hypothetical protein AOZ06_21215 [Kibdelosporangium phytohabitans]MBE1469700.1 hypothetical protein [Kibdelosporangium phytohabitans]